MHRFTFSLLRGLECDRWREILVHGICANGFYTDYICYIPASLCIPKSTLKQVMSLESPPALRTTVLPYSSSEQICSGKEGDVLFQLEENLPARIAVTDTPLSLNDGTDGHEMESPTTEYMVKWFHNISRRHKAIRKRTKDWAQKGSNPLI